jgi:hypothetical protein
MDDLATSLRLFAVLLALSVLLLLASVYLDGIPLVGDFPGDLEIDVPGGFVYLPFTSSILLGALLASIAYAIQKFSRK